MLDDLAGFTHDPLGFVKWAFPWGEPGTALENRPGPEPWQAAQLERIGAKLRAGASRGAVIEEDIASGHGVVVARWECPPAACAPDSGFWPARS